MSWRMNGLIVHEKVRDYRCRLTSMAELVAITDSKGTSSDAESSGLSDGNCC